MKKIVKNINHLSFFTASLLNWYPLLKEDKFKDIIIESMRYLSVKKKVIISAFVIMPSHIHLVWKINDSMKKEDVQRDFLKFTAHTIKKYLSINNPNLLKIFYVNLKDRKYQFWQRNPLSVIIYTDEVAQEKINYIHLNPVNKKWKLCNTPLEYKYSSARFYYEGIKVWDFLMHYSQVYD